ncbi:MAG: molybdopterin-dependent oxidoreductase [Bryobacterales bacterium]|nr:molybdopterin-dependent oxidoreductase [Bryobacterales bacterium]
MPSRRKWMMTGLAASAAGAVSLKLAAHKGLIPPDHGGIYGPGATLTYAAQRLLTRGAMAREYPRAAISPKPFANPTQFRNDAYDQMAKDGFRAWRLRIEGSVTRPREYSLDQLRQLPVRSQATQMICEEGWSFIAEWAGVELAGLLGDAGMRAETKFIVYESMEQGWWDSLDLDDAMHPQTLVAHSMNGSELPSAHGGPLRMRVPRQIGYKSVKYLARIIATDDLRKFGKGLGSPGPEYGYSWYAGI